MGRGAPGTESGLAGDKRCTAGGCAGTDGLKTLAAASAAAAAPWGQEVIVAVATPTTAGQGWFH